MPTPIRISWQTLRNGLIHRLSRWLHRSKYEAWLPDLEVQPLRPRVLRHRSLSANATRSLATRSPATRSLATRSLATSEPTKPNLDPRPAVSAVVGSFNRLSLLKHAINSLRSELTSCVHEIIVIDGGSSDGSIEWLVNQQDVITIVQHNRYEVDGQPHRRMSWGRFMNLGFRNALGDYVLMMSDDCYLLPGSLSAGLRKIESARTEGLNVGACAFYFRDWPHDQGYYVQRTFGGNLMVNHGLYTREALANVGYCDEENFVFYKADSDLSLRIWQNGFVIIASEESICEHYVGPSEANDALRGTNSSTLEWDRFVMRCRWPYMTADNVVAKMGRIHLQREPDQTVNQIWGNPSAESSAGVSSRST